jgi:hypothetical protein
MTQPGYQVSLEPLPLGGSTCPLPLTYWRGLLVDPFASFVITPGTPTGWRYRASRLKTR